MGKKKSMKPYVGKTEQEGKFEIKDKKDNTKIKKLEIKNANRSKKKTKRQKDKNQIKKIIENL